LNDTEAEFASVEATSAAFWGAAERRILLLSFGAVDDGVFGLDSSSSSPESRALDRRPVIGGMVPFTRCLAVVQICPDYGRINLETRRQRRRDLT